MTSGSTRCLTQLSVRSALKVATGDQQQQLVVPLSPPSASAAAVQALDYRHIYGAVYSPLGYSACAVPAASSGVLCWLPLHKPVDCKTLFTQYSQQLQQHKPVFPPPEKLPAGQQGEFLLQGAAQLSPYYIQQSDYAPDASVTFNLTQFQELHKAAASRLFLGHYDNACFTVYQALDCHPINGSRGAIFGTELPWLEAILSAFGECGCGRVRTQRNFVD
jgi:hypothetical protein